jgi:DNA-directed RNA polymerase subunit omega
MPIPYGDPPSRGRVGQPPPDTLASSGGLARRDPEFSSKSLAGRWFRIRLPAPRARLTFDPPRFTMRDDYLRQAHKVITDANILINVISKRVKQLRSGQAPLVDSLEKLSLEDIALREVIEGKITYELPSADEAAKA